MFANLLRKAKPEKQGKTTQVDEAEKTPASDNATSLRNNQEGILAISKPSTELATVADDGKESEIPVLDPDDEQFLERLTTPSTSGVAGEGEDGDDGLKPPLPPRITTPDLSWDSDTESFRRIVQGDDTTDDDAEEHDQQLLPKSDEDLKGKGKDAGPQPAQPAKKANRLSLSFLRRDKAKAQTRVKNAQKSGSTKPATPPLAPANPTAEPDLDAVRREQADLQRVLDDLDLAASRDGSNVALALSRESAALARAFTQVLRDLAAGTPTAAHDLVALLDRGDGALGRSWTRLPGSLRRLVQRLPDKLTASLAPELLAVAAESQGLMADGGAGAGVKAAAGKKISLAPRNLVDLATKPGAVAGMLRAIVNALKARWPAFIGTNVLWSVALFLLLFVLWYCHKRGKEVRLEREKSEAEAAAASDAEKGPEGVVTGGAETGEESTGLPEAKDMAATTRTNAL